MTAIADKNGKLVYVGDLVTIDNGGRSTNFGGSAKVSKISAPWILATAVDRLTGGWVKGQQWTFPPERVTFLGGKASLDRDPRPNDPTSKPTNPKDVIGSDKLPLHLWPETATVMGCLGLLEGALKYGRSNWRETGVRVTIYVDAVRRHINAYFEGEDIDPDSGMPHLAHALACLAILVDADAAGMLNDDRQYPGGYRRLVEELTPFVPAAKENHADKSPKHWTIEDAS